MRSDATCSFESTAELLRSSIFIEMNEILRRVTGSAAHRA